MRKLTGILAVAAISSTVVTACGAQSSGKEALVVPKTAQAPVSATPTAGTVQTFPGLQLQLSAASDTQAVTATAATALSAVRTANIRPDVTRSAPSLARLVRATSDSYGDTSSGTFVRKIDNELVYALEWDSAPVQAHPAIGAKYTGPATCPLVVLVDASSGQVVYAAQTCS